ncbi:MAG: Rha family transcriptional regulator [Psychrobacter sp.]
MSSIALNENGVELVTVNNGQPITTSQAVAEKFGKRHDNVLQAINNIECSDNFRQLNFKLVMESMTYTDKNGLSKSKQTKRVGHVEMTKDGFTFLVMGFTGKKAAKFKEDYINEFNRMTEYLNTTRFAHIELQIWQNKEVGDEASGSYHGKGLRHRRDTKQENHENIKRLGTIVQPMLVGFDESLAELTNKDVK